MQTVWWCRRDCATHHLRMWSSSEEMILIIWYFSIKEEPDSQLTSSYGIRIVAWIRWSSMELKILANDIHMYLFHFFKPSRTLCRNLFLYGFLHKKNWGFLYWKLDLPGLYWLGPQICLNQYAYKPNSITVFCVEWNKKIIIVI